jgi:hypothetical protein
MRKTVGSVLTFAAVGLLVLGITTLSGAATIKSETAGGGYRPYIDLEKYVAVDGGAWLDADLPPGPDVPDGSYVEFRFVVTYPAPAGLLENIVLTDNIFDLGGCPVPTSLGPGESFECVIGPFECVQGQHTNTGTVTGTAYGQLRSDTDDANYFGRCTGGEQPGTGTPGYWKNHPDAWPVEEITVGGILYTRDEAIELMGTAGRRDKTYTMFRALVSAMLNVMIGNDPSCIEDVIMEADAWMALYPVGSGVPASSDAWQENEWLYLTMDEYNNGLLCAPHRDSDEWMLK